VINLVMDVQILDLITVFDVTPITFYMKKIAKKLVRYNSTQILLPEDVNIKIVIALVSNAGVMEFNNVELVKITFNLSNNFHLVLINNVCKVSILR